MAHWLGVKLGLIACWLGVMGGLVEPTVVVAESWPILQPQDEGFAIAMPGQPKKSTRTVQLRQETTYRLQTAAGVFQLSYLRLDGPPDEDAAVMLLKEIPPQVAQNASGKIVANQAFRFDDDYPAREFEIETRDGNLRTRLIVVDDRLFQITVIGTKEWVHGPQARKFWKSFRVLRESR